MVRNPRISMLISSLLVISLLLVGCAQALPQTGQQETPAAETPAAVEQASPTPETTGAETVAEQLRAVGATVQPVGVVQQPFFDVDAQVLDVNGEEIQVFEFPSEADAQQAISLVSITQDGIRIGETAPQFAATPHFFQQGPFVILFVGEGQAILDPLTQAFGQAISPIEVVSEEEFAAELEDIEVAQELQTAGATVSLVGSVEQPFFPVQGRVLEVNGQQIQVFEFASDQDADDAAELVSLGGLLAGDFANQFPAPPHVFRQDRTIVLYAGEDQPTLDLLEQVMGAELEQQGGAAIPPTTEAQEQVLQDLMADLQSAGATVELGAEIQQPFFPVSAQVLVVNGQDVQVFAFPTVEDAEDAAALISPEGFEIANSMVEFVGPPHFFHEGRVIALFIGEDQAIVDLLTQVLGQPIAGPASNGE